MTTYYHVDGKLVPSEDATVSVRDRGFAYGDAAFETLRVYGETPFEWDAHLARLQRTCETLGFGDALPAGEQLRERVIETLAANDLTDAYAKLSVSRGVQPGKLTPQPSVDPTIVVVVSELPRGGRDGERVWDSPARVESVDTRRVPAEAIPAHAKTHNYLNGILARLELTDPGADEALLRSVDGYVTEGATSNIFWVKNGRVVTPSTELPLLPGITRDVVCQSARDAGIAVDTGRYELATLRNADELFLTNSTWEIRPVSLFDGIAFETGPITRELQAAFDERVEVCY